MNLSHLRDFLRVGIAEPFVDRIVVGGDAVIVSLGHALIEAVALLDESDVIAGELRDLEIDLVLQLSEHAASGRTEVSRVGGELRAIGNEPPVDWHSLLLHKHSDRGFYFQLIV